MLAALAATVVFQAANVLTPNEAKVGWRLLFDGKSLSGWHNFKAKGVRPGWVVQGDALVCADPHQAGDIVTNEDFDWFELSLEYKLSVGGNSGVLFHVAPVGDATWQSGPEIQLHDRYPSPEGQKTGWLYALYPAAAKMTKPEGEWNRLFITISPRLCRTEVNGVECVRFVLGSDDFKARVARSKFGSMPNFAKFDKGAIALQGDHGVVSFRNVKIRPLEPK